MEPWTTTSSRRIAIPARKLVLMFSVSCPRDPPPPPAKQHVQVSRQVARAASRGKPGEPLVDAPWVSSD